MGLAGPRKRVKLSHDPNNTTWTRNTEGFGHKIMTSQGWQPGQYLGAKDAPHAEFHTSANATFIRVLAKDDNLGIGAKRGSGLNEGECTGLDVFQTLLGRLNGRDEDEMEQEKKSREDLKRAIYTERRWGSVRFVKGGFLIGDKIQNLIDAEAERVRQSESTRKIEEPVSNVESPEEDAKAQRKREKQEKRDRKEQRRAEREKRRADANNDLTTEKSSDVAVQDQHEDGERKKSKKRAQTTPSEKASVENAEEVVAKKPSKRRTELESTADVIASSVSSPGTSDIAVEISEAVSNVPQTRLTGRHAVRSRFIAQKRLAVMDTASLNQIFMIKQ